MNELPVREVMTRLVVTFRPEDKLYDAAKRLLSNRISGAPVVEAGRLVGVVSEADLMKAFKAPARRDSMIAPHPPMSMLLRNAPMPDPQYSSVEDVMTTKVVSLGPNDSVWDAAALIDRFGVRRLPVVDDDGCVVGIVTRSDLVRFMARSHEASRAS